MPQLLGHNSEGNAFYETPAKGTGYDHVLYWVETKSPSKQQLVRKGPWGGDRVILTAPVIVLLHEDGHIQARYLNEQSTEAEIETFTRKYALDAQQRKWCFTALEEINPVDKEG